MSKTTDELEMEVIEDMMRDGMDFLTILFAMWEMGERGNQIAHKRVRDVLWMAIEDRRENHVSEPFVMV